MRTDQQQDFVPLFSLDRYTFGTKEPQDDEYDSAESRLEAITEHFQSTGKPYRSVEAVLLIHDHNHPHMLCLQMSGQYFKTIGGSVQDGESDHDAVQRILQQRIGATGQNKEEWKIGKLLSTWYRPELDQYMYPYCPPHISMVKEIKRVYLVHLPSVKVFAIPKNFKFMALPLFELYDNQQRYGQIMSSIPHLISHIKFRYVP
ncbi:hypothetical protein MP228_010894 [Amoeboaphelidium protococcarum]|nr:hypothetical protein MP228_010894 [Amoeboaphelidium protococcarum]